MVSGNETPTLADLRVFREAAQRRGITAAALALDVPKSAVSKVLTRLEAQLGVKLLERSSRRVALTRAGELLSVKAESLLLEADCLTASLRQEHNEPRGTVRITAPPELGTRFIERVVPAIATQFPELRIVMQLGYEFDDLQDPAIDLALRAGQVHDDRLVGVPIGSFRRLAVASPSYLKAHPVRRPSELAQHPCLVLSANQNTAEWAFSRGTAVEQVRVAGPLAVLSFTALLHAARAGMGIARAPEFTVAEWLRRGELVKVLPGWSAPAAKVFLVHRFAHDRIARVAAVLNAARPGDWLAAA